MSQADQEIRTDAPTPWYRDGLRFECTRCGACCTGTPGYVWVDEERIDLLARHIGLDSETFAKRFVRRVGSRLSLIERPNGDCVFWSPGEGCTVYESRPLQCRTWPFWWQNVESPEAWDEVREGCPGAGQGPLHSLLQIEAAIDRRRGGRT